MTPAELQEHHGGRGPSSGREAEPRPSGRHGDGEHYRADRVSARIGVVERGDMQPIGVQRRACERRLHELLDEAAGDVDGHERDRRASAQPGACDCDDDRRNESACGLRPVKCAPGIAWRTAH
jgi:hypothetical protein